MKIYLLTLSIAMAATLLPAKHVNADIPSYSCYNGDCNVTIFQYPDTWSMHVTCGGGPINYFSGEGCYDGTICGGMPNPHAAFCEV